MERKAPSRDRERGRDAEPQHARRRSASAPDIGALRAALAYDKHDLDNVLVEQHMLYDQVSEQVEISVSRRDETKLELELAKADADRHVRKKHADEKLTETAIKQLIEVDEDVVELQRKFLDQSAEVRQWSVLKGSYDQRLSAIKIQAQLFAAGYWTRSSVGASRNKLEERSADEARRGVSEERRRRRGDDE